MPPQSFRRSSLRRWLARWSAQIGARGNHMGPTGSALRVQGVTAAAAGIDSHHRRDPGLSAALAGSRRMPDRAGAAHRHDGPHDHAPSRPSRHSSSLTYRRLLHRPRRGPRRRAGARPQPGSDRPGAYRRRARRPPAERRTAGSRGRAGDAGLGLHLPVRSDGPRESVIRKTDDDGFDGTPLGDLLMGAGVRALAICGVLSEMCVSDCPYGPGTRLPRRPSARRACHLRHSGGAWHQRERPGRDVLPGGRMGPRRRRRNPAPRHRRHFHRPTRHPRKQGNTRPPGVRSHRGRCDRHTVSGEPAPRPSAPRPVDDHSPRRRAPPGGPPPQPPQPPRALQPPTLSVHASLQCGHVLVNEVVADSVGGGCEPSAV